MKRLIFSILFCVTLCIPTLASEWIIMSDNSGLDKDSIKYYTKDNGEYSFNIKEYWWKLYNENNKIENINNKRVEYVLFNSLLDITNNRIATKTMASYDKDGNSLYTHTFKDIELEWEKIIPESNGEIVAKLVKSSQRYRNKIYKKQYEEMVQNIKEIVSKDNN